VGWAGAGCAGLGNCLVSLTADENVTATFAPIPPSPATTTPPAHPVTLVTPVTHALNVVLVGSGRGTVTFSQVGLTCPSTCAVAAAANGVYTGTASAATGSRFTGWSGACTGTGPCVVTLVDDATVTATFGALPPVPSIARPQVRGTTVVVKLSKSTEASGLQCALVPARTSKHDHKPNPVYKNCGSVVTFRHVRKGRYLLYVRATAPGGLDSPAATRSVTVAA
jgi:hypothetical protein